MRLLGLGRPASYCCSSSGSTHSALQRVQAVQAVQNIVIELAALRQVLWCVFLPEALSQLVYQLQLALIEASLPLLAFATVMQSKYAAARKMPRTWCFNGVTWPCTGTNVLHRNMAGPHLLSKPAPSQRSRQSRDLPSCRTCHPFRL